MGILMETAEVNFVTNGYRRRAVETECFGANAMAAPNEAFYSDALHTIAISTRETEFGSIIEPIPITLKAYKQYQSVNGYAIPQSVITSIPRQPQVPTVPSVSNSIESPQKVTGASERITRPPKKKWIKEYLEEEPKSPVSVRVVTGVSVTPHSNGVVRPSSPVAVVSPPVALEPAPAPPALHSAPLLDFVQEHSRLRTTSNSHGPPQIPSPPSVSSTGSSGSGGSVTGGTPRAGTREVHNKLEKNRRAHLKECFELLKRQLPATPDDKKISNLSILGSAIRYIQVLRRKERECEHEMERLAREKIAAQQRLAALKREAGTRPLRPRVLDSADDKDRDDVVNGHAVGIPLSITSSPPRSIARMEPSPPHTLNLSTNLRTLPIQITPTTSQVVRTSYGTRHNTLTLTTLAPADPTQNGQTVENGVTNVLSTLVHPAQIHLPLSQVVGGGGLVVAPALQLLSAAAPLRVLPRAAHPAHPAHPAHTPSDGLTGENHRLSKENGIISPSSSSKDGMMVNGLTPLVVSQPATHLLQTHTLTHKMVETQVMKGSVAPLTVSAQYLSTTIVKPLVVVSSAHSATLTPHATHTPHTLPAPHAPHTARPTHPPHPS